MIGRNHRLIAEDSPDVNVYSRGWLAILLGGTGVADLLKFVRKKDDESYELAEVSLSDHAHTGTYQPLDAELTAIAGLTSAADRVPYYTGSGTAALATFTAAGRAIVDDADATAQRATLGLVIGTNVQAWDADLDTWAGKTAPSGTVVGTTDTQSLSAKTLSDPTIDGQVLVSGTNPTVAVNTSVCGSSATASVTFGNDTSMRIEVSCAGGAGYAAGRVVTITFAATRPSSSFAVYIQPVSSQALSKGWRPSSHTTTTVDIITDTAPAAGETLQFNVLILGDT